MSEPMRIGLDNPIFAGRLRVDGHEYDEEEGLADLPGQHPGRHIQKEAITNQVTAETTTSSLLPVWARPLSKPEVQVNTATINEVAVVRQPSDSVAVENDLSSAALLQSTYSTTNPGWQSEALERRGLMRRLRKADKVALGVRLRKYSSSQKMLFGLALLIFVAGLGVCLQTVLTNHQATVQVAALSKKTKQSPSSVPSVVKPNTDALSQYMVAPDLPRYIKIPKLGVNARVLQVGTNKDGSLGTPSSVFDTAWYTGSAKPGQPGATLIDGHVSSWTAHGVFYGLKLLQPGDQIQIQRGDGQILSYQVVKSQVYSDGNVDMQAAMTPIVAGKPGLNLITCTGQVKPGTSEFNQRIIVFAEQI